MFTVMEKSSLDSVQKAAETYTLALKKKKSMPLV